ncbi:putative thymidylate kinase [Vibrio phage phiKT1028]|nr:putative thymidylate kinase [Vibrio phage phiKT1028]
MTTKFNKKGRFASNPVVIAFEGMDYAGKSTMIETIRKKIADTGRRPPKVFAEPRKDTEEWRQIREMIISPNVPKLSQVYLSVAQRVTLYNEVILPELRQRRSVITDRCFLTSMVYQHSDSFNWIDIFWANYYSTNTMGNINQLRQPIPDIIVFMGISHATYMERLGKDRDTVEHIETHISDPEVFQEFSDRYHESLKFMDGMDKPVIIESNDPDEIYERLKELGCDF